MENHIEFKIDKDKLTFLRFTPGHSELYSIGSTDDELREIFDEIRSCFTPEGDFNPYSIHAERYALCLLKAGKKEVAREFLQSIVDQIPVEDLLYTNQEATDIRKKFPYTADSFGKLGSLGMVRLAELESEHGSKEIAFKIFSELIKRLKGKEFSRDIVSDAYNGLLLLEEDPEKREVLEKERTGYIY